MKYSICKTESCIAYSAGFSEYCCHCNNPDKTYLIKGNQSFQEYFLLGSLAGLLVGLLIGLFI